MHGVQKETCEEEDDHHDDTLTELSPTVSVLNLLHSTTDVDDSCKNTEQHSMEVASNPINKQRNPVQAGPAQEY